MFGEEISADKVKRMYEYIDAETKKLTTYEDAEFATRRRRFYKAWQLKNDYCEKLKNLDVEFNKSLNKREKDVRNFIIGFCVYAVIGYFFNWFHSDGNAIAGFIFGSFFFLSHLSAELDSKNYRQLKALYQSSVDSYALEIGAVGCGYIEYESAYLTRDGEDADTKKNIQNLFTANVDIEILHGLKSSPPVVRF